MAARREKKFMEVTEATERVLRILWKVREEHRPEVLTRVRLVADPVSLRPQGGPIANYEDD